MSRGFGKLQNGVLRALKDHPKTDTMTLATAVFGAEINQVAESQLVSLRRALRLLEKKGLAFDLGRRNGDRVREWGDERYGLFLQIRRLQRELAYSWNEPEALRLRAILDAHLKHACNIGLDVHEPWPDETR